MLWLYPKRKSLLSSFLTHRKRRANRPDKISPKILAVLVTCKFSLIYGSLIYGLHCIYIYIYIYIGTKKKTEPINFFITSTKIKQNNSNFYTRTSGHGEYYGPNFSCTESTSYPEKKKRQELNLWISVKNIWVLFFFFILIWSKEKIQGVGVSNLSAQY